MAFKPGKSQHFYMIAKHSGLALTVANGNLGNTLYQAKLNPESSNQKFRFDAGPSIFWIVLPAYNNRYIAIHESSMADNWPVIEWQWEPHDTNLMFEFVPAEDGYYRIVNRHSGKYFDITGNDKAENAKLFQHRLMTTENQLFKPVPVPNQPLGPNPRTLAETNNDLRTGVLALIEKIPEVGGGISFIVGMFWKPKDVLADFWDQMKSYVDIRINEKIKEQKLIDLADHLKGIIENIEEVKRSVDTDKGTRLQSTIDAIVRMQNEFLGKSTDILPYLVGLGTILVTLRQAMVVDYKNLFGIDIPANVKTQNILLVQQTIEKYSAAVEKGRTELMTWRMGLIPDKIEEHVEIEMATESNDIKGGSMTRETSAAKDGFNGWERFWGYYSNDGKTWGDPDHKAKAIFALEEHRKQARIQFSAELDELLTAAKYWPYFDPAKTEKYKETTVKQELGIFGNNTTGKTFAGVADKIISKIVVHSKPFAKGAVVCGLEVFYKSKAELDKSVAGDSDGLKGSTGTSSATLQLEANEYINSTYGFGKDRIDGLWLTTNKGNIVGQAERLGANMFSADLPDSFKPRLVKISGGYGNDAIEQLSFHWEYEY